MKNCAELSFADIAKSRVPHDLAQILGVEIGPHADITNLRFDKIICLQDADADGYNIRSLVCTYLIVTMPQLIEEGKLYTGVPPLYTLSDASAKKYKSKIKKNFLFDKHEYQTLINDIIADNIQLCFETEDGANILTRGETKAWLTLNRQYPSLLEELSKKTAIHPDIIEQVCDVIIAQSCDEKPDIKSEIEKRFDEMTYDVSTKSLQGSYKYEDYYLIIDDLFISIADNFIKLLAQNASLFVAYHNKNDDAGIWTRTTIGHALNDIHGKYALDITQRFKGLGEVNSQLLFYSTLNPKIRKLVRLTMDDRQKAMEDVLLLHGKKEVDGRRNILLGKDVSIDDIDN
jgi:DNA gyrase subunit B